MKMGIRTPNLKKSLKAKTTGRAKRALKSSINPLYGKKGVGIITDPKKAVYNKVYSKTTVDALAPLKKTAPKSPTSKPVTKTNQSATTTKSTSNIPKYSIKNNKIIIGKNSYTIKQLNSYKNLMLFLGWFLVLISFLIMPIGVLTLIIGIISIYVASSYKKIINDVKKKNPNF